MSVVLCLSSQVARGYVGGSAARVALERLGHEVWLLPTVILSNHPGHPLFAGEQVPPGRLRAILEALQSNGWLADVDAVLTGYLPTAEHVALAARAVGIVRAGNPEAMLLCDPILGDDPDGLYLDEATAASLKETLLPVAQIVTPNRFELAWLSGRPVSDAKTAMAAARTLPSRLALTTSIPAGDDICNLLTSEAGAWRTQLPRRAGAPHGAGDLLAALFLARLLEGAGEAHALGLATAGVEAVLAASGLADELRLPQAPQGWTRADAWPVEAVEA